MASTANSPPTVGGRHVVGTKELAEEIDHVFFPIFVQVGGEHGRETKRMRVTNFVTRGENYRLTLLNQALNTQQSDSQLHVVGYVEFSPQAIDVHADSFGAEATAIGLAKGECDLFATHALEQQPGDIQFAIGQLQQVANLAPFPRRNQIFCWVCRREQVQAIIR